MTTFFIRHLNKLYLFLLFGSIFFQQCKKETATDTLTGNHAVVEAYLQADKHIAIKITKEIPYTSDDSAEYLPNLNVYIIHNNMMTKLFYKGSAIYADTNMLVMASDTYKLQFDYNGFTIAATTVIPTKPTNFKASTDTLSVPDFSSGPPSSGTMPTFPDPIKLTWDNPDKSFFLVAVKAHSTATTISNGSGNKLPVFRKEPTQGAEQELRMQEFEYLGMHDVILYKVTGDYAALYKTTGTNSQNLASPQTNIKNGLGIFAGLNQADNIELLVQKQ